MQAQAFRTVPFIPLGQYFLATGVSRKLRDFVRWPTPIFRGLRKEG